MKISKNIFRKYDIRGRENAEELNKDSLELLGKAFGVYLIDKGIKKTIVGADSRKTSKEFKEAAIKGLLSSGVDVIDVGMILTPMMHWAQHHFKVKGGLMVTASHNPKGWNGLKLSADYSKTLNQDELLSIYEMVKTNNFDSELSLGERSKEDIKDAYIKDLSDRVNIEKKFKLVVNTGNGTAGPFAGDLFRNLGCEVIEHNFEIDPDYPNYTPNPAEMDMMMDTADVVKKNNADLGIALDADGDRLGVISEKGDIVWPDIYAIFLSRLVLEESPGATLLFDVKSSKALEEEIRAHGGNPIMVPTGHTIVKQKMQENNAAMGSELSGHIFIKHRFYGHDDALFAAALLLEYLSKSEKMMSELVGTVPKYVSSPGYNAHCPDDKKFDVIEDLIAEFKDEGYEVIDIDGARVEFENGWGIARASNTTPNITLRFEANTKKRLEEIQDIFKEKLSKYSFVSEEWIAG
ncbi:MAG: phosphomannomutase/phosphoglucomutase [Candidatus Spechtbacterales bacterium]|nr:phosphomannomutase/phosphoglucomutase [Candidatus Spechtbacterales bacterium]